MQNIPCVLFFRMVFNIKDNYRRDFLEAKKKQPSFNAGLCTTWNIIMRGKKFIPEKGDRLATRFSISEQCIKQTCGLKQ